MKNLLFLLVIFCSFDCFASDGSRITGFKYDDELPSYTPPPSSVFKAPRSVLPSGETLPDLQFYVTEPPVDTKNPNHKVPILLFATGSSSIDSVVSVIHAYRYFLEEILNIGCAKVAPEQIGVSFDSVDEDLFLNTTREQGDITIIWI